MADSNGIGTGSSSDANSKDIGTGSSSDANSKAIGTGSNSANIMGDVELETWQVRDSRDGTIRRRLPVPKQFPKNTGSSSNVNSMDIGADSNDDRKGIGTGSSSDANSKGIGTSSSSDANGISAAELADIFRDDPKETVVLHDASLIQWLKHVPRPPPKPPPAHLLRAQAVYEHQQ
jgi:hypothetical protein